MPLFLFYFFCGLRTVVQTCTANLSINRRQNKRGRTVSKILCPVTQTEYIYVGGGVDRIDDQYYWLSNYFASADISAVHNLLVSYVCVFPELFPRSLYFSTPHIWNFNCATVLRDKWPGAKHLNLLALCLDLRQKASNPGLKDCFKCHRDFKLLLRFSKRNFGRRPSCFVMTSLFKKMCKENAQFEWNDSLYWIADSNVM